MGAKKLNEEALALQGFSDEELAHELKRRAKERKENRCTYCGRKVTTPGCRQSHLHTNKTPLPGKQVGDTYYTFTGPFCEGALSVFGISCHAYDVQKDEDMEQEYEDGNLLADDGEVTQKEIEAAYEIALKRKA